MLQYFKGMVIEAGLPYQSLINLYLRDCLAQNREVQIKWPDKRARSVLESLALAARAHGGAIHDARIAAMTVRNPLIG